jgi:hypothetical protein
MVSTRGTMIQSQIKNKRSYSCCGESNLTIRAQDEVQTGVVLSKIQKPYLSQSLLLYRTGMIGNYGELHGWHGLTNTYDQTIFLGVLLSFVVNNVS